MAKYPATLLLIILCICCSCNSTHTIISNAIERKEEVSIRIEKYTHEKTDTVNFYNALVKKNVEAYELHVTKKEMLEIYKLPANKLTLLCEMECFLTELHINNPQYAYRITIQNNKKKRVYKINTDIIHDFIMGLKK